MPERESVHDIVASAQAARRSLSDLEAQIQAELDELDFRLFSQGRPISEEERAQRRQLRASQGEVREAFAALAFVTLQRLDDSAEVAQLRVRMDRINQGLADDLDHLRATAALAATVAQVADGLAKVASQLVSRAAGLGLGR